MTSVEDRLYAYGRVLEDHDAADCDPHQGVIEFPTRPAFARVGAVGILVCALIVSGLVVRLRLDPRRVDAGGADRSSPEWTFPLLGGAGSYIDTFGAPRPPGRTGSRRNDGVDVFAPFGTSVVALRGGSVSETGAGNLGGRRLSIRDRDGNCYVYEQLGSLAPGTRVGRQVNTGDALGTVGADTGTPSHLHMEIRPRCGSAVNPTQILRSVERLVPPTAVVPVQGIQVAAEVASSLESMLTAAEATGVELAGLGYRSSDAQLRLRRKNCGTSPEQIFLLAAASCRPPTAKAGGGPHERGVAVDFTVDGRSLQRGAPAHDWLLENAARFGFVPVVDEPWHWEWQPGPA